MKKVFSILALTLLSLTTFAQETSSQMKSFWDDPMLPLYLISIFVIMVVVLVAFVAIYLFKIINILSDLQEKEKASKLGITYAPKRSLWNNLVDQLNAAVPVEKEKDIVMDHNYDGIRELDNHLPPWWKWLFYGCIAWSLIYLIVYHVTDTLPLQWDEYQQEISMAGDQSRKLKASQPQEAIDENALVFSNDKALVEKGKAVFVSFNCASCHKSDGGGNSIGPNLTDEYWLHGGEVKNIFTTIKNGVVEKGMPAWGKSMSPQDVKAATFFVMSLKGTNPVGAKAPQGLVYKEEIIKSDSTIVKSDSTKVQASL